MKKKFGVTVLATAMTLAMGLTAFADVTVPVGYWEQASDGRWKFYNEENYTFVDDDGEEKVLPEGWLVNGYEWLDGNKDGTAELYCFGSDTYMIADKTMQNEEGEEFYFNSDGQWEADGEVQTQDSQYKTDESVSSDTVDISDPEQWFKKYTADDGDTIELFQSTGTSIAINYNNFDSVFSMTRVSDGHYKYASYTMTLNPDGTITYKGKVYYPD